jgi:hypothetical protein
MSETDHSSDLVETILQILTNIKPPQEKKGEDKIVDDKYDSTNLLVDTVLNVMENINSPTPSSVDDSILENLNTESYDSDLLVNTILEILNGTLNSSGAQDGTGETGTTGESETGTTGERGETGTTGERGETGTTGERGETGTTGERGETGPTGPTGATGRTGPTGETGTTGETDTTGETGTTGETDTTGETGPNNTGNSRISNVTNYLNTKTQSVKDGISRLQNSLKTVSNNSEFISIVNKTMRKIDSRCDLVALIHLIETLLARKPENKLTANERTFYENILKLLKDKLYMDTANKDRQYPLTISLSEIVDEVENKINTIDVDNPTFKTNDFDPKLTVVDNLSFFRQILRPSTKD